MPTSDLILDNKFLKEQYAEIFALRNNDFFTLLDMDFYLQDFLFFVQEARFFAEIEHLSIDKAEHLGLVSTLVYLSAKIHFAIDNDEQDNFPGKMQFPILLGDLLYGKVIEILSTGAYSEYIDDYLGYLQSLNAKEVDYFAQKCALEAVEEAQFAELAVLTARLVGSKKLSLAYKLGEAFSKNSLYEQGINNLTEISAEQQEIFKNIFKIDIDPKTVIKSTTDLLKNI